MFFIQKKTWEEKLNSLKMADFLEDDLPDKLLAVDSLLPVLPWDIVLVWDFKLS